MRLSRILREAEAAASNRPPSYIRFYDADGHELGIVPRADRVRFTNQTATDHARMDQFKANHPETCKAVVDGLEAPFEFDEQGFSVQCRK